jgi:hypothetical protein
MLGAVKRLLFRESQVQPLLVVFEDLHWIDGDTQALLDSLVESLGSARLLLLVNYRPEYEHRWGSKSAYSQLRLDTLPVGSTGELLAALLGPDPGLAPLTQKLVKRGNPFFLEETVRTLVETGALVGQRGAYRLTHPVETLQVRPRARAILAARIDRLRGGEQLLRAASVFGKMCLTLLAAITRQPARPCGKARHLQEAEFTRDAAVSDLEHTFKHALTHEVTYGSLLGDRRRELNAQIVAAIRSVRGPLVNMSGASPTTRCAGVCGTRRVIWPAAGNRALDRSAAREALAHFEQARVALQELPESRERTEQLIDLCFEQRNALMPLGGFARLGEILGEAQALAEGLDDQWRLGWAFGYQANLQSVLGEHARSIEAAQSACAVAEAVGDLGLRLVANYYLGQAFWFAGVPGLIMAAAIGLFVRNPPHTRTDDTPKGSVVPLLNALAAAGAELGQFAEAVAAGKRASTSPDRWPSYSRSGPATASGTPICGKGLRASNAGARARSCALPRDGVSRRTGVRGGVAGFRLSAVGAGGRCGAAAGGGRRRARSDADSGIACVDHHVPGRGVPRRRTRRRGAGTGTASSGAGAHP